MEDTKPWWASRTIWTGVLGTAFAVASAAHILPDGWSQETVLEGVLAVTGLLAIVFRKKATTSV